MIPQQELLIENVSIIYNVMHHAYNAVASIVAQYR